MKTICCDFKGYFYIDVIDDATPDQIKSIAEKYISELESCENNFFTIHEYRLKEAY